MRHYFSKLNKSMHYSATLVYMAIVTYVAIALPFFSTAYAASFFKLICSLFIHLYLLSKQLVLF